MTKEKFDNEYAAGYLNIIDAAQTLNVSNAAVRIWQEDAEAQLLLAKSANDKAYYIGAVLACRNLLTTSSKTLYST